MPKLDNKVAVISGGARGIGAAIATALAEEGASVVIGDRLEAEGRALADKLNGAGHRALFVRLDVTDQAQWIAALDTAIAHFGSLNIVVNNAGIVMNRNIEELTVDDFQKQIDVNVYGCLHGMQQAIARMKNSGGGSIVNISSIAANVVSSITAGYGPSKAAVANISKCAAVHCAQQGYGIRINSVHPGPIQTPMLFGDGDLINLDAMKPMLGAIPMGRIGQPAEIAAAVVFLASDASSYMTASEVTVDGGLCSV